MTEPCSPVTLRFPAPAAAMPSCLAAQSTTSACVDRLSRVADITCPVLQPSSPDELLSNEPASITHFRQKGRLARPAAPECAFHATIADAHADAPPSPSYPPMAAAAAPVSSFRTKKCPDAGRPGKSTHATIVCSGWRRHGRRRDHSIAPGTDCVPASQQGACPTIHYRVHFPPSQDMFRDMKTSFVLRKIHR